MSNRDPELVLAFQSVDLKGPTDFSTYPVTVDRISYLPFYIWDHQTTLTLLLFPEVHVSNLCLRGRVLLLGVTNLPLSMILRLHFGTVSTVWYFLFFILWQGMFYPLLYFVFTLSPIIHLPNGLPLAGTSVHPLFFQLVRVVHLTLSGHLSSPIVFLVGRVVHRFSFFYLSMFSVSSFCVSFPMLSVSLDFPFLVSPTVFSLTFIL